MRHIVRIKRLIIQKSGILRNVDISFKPVTLIIGDNERGKTQILNWIAKGLFEKPNNDNTNTWSDTIGTNKNIQMDLNPFYTIYDGERMRNLLFVQETDLLLKYKNYDENAKKEYWNNEIQFLLYGQDIISDHLQNSFLKAMGVGNSVKNGWLRKLHDGLNHLRSALDNALPNIEMIHSKEMGLYEINNSLGKIEEEELIFNSKEELYFLTDKINTGKKYIDLYYQKEEFTKENLEIQNFQQNYNSMTQELQNKEESLFNIEDKIAECKIKISHLQEKENSIRNNPMHDYHNSLGENILSFLIGISMTILGVFFAYYTMTSPQFNLNKILALVFFIIGIGFILKTLLKEFSAQYIEKQEKGSFIHERLIVKAQKNFLKKYQELEEIEKEYQYVQQECVEIRKKLKTKKYQNDTYKQNQYQYIQVQNEFDILEDKVYQLFGTTNIQEIMDRLEYLNNSLKDIDLGFSFDSLKKIREDKNELLEMRGNSSKDYEKTKYSVINKIKPLLEELKSVNDKVIIEHFYPEIMQLEIKHDLSYFFELWDQVDELINQVGKDRYLADKLLEVYQNVESNSETLLSKTIKTPFFEYLVQNIFNGKYKTFKTIFEDNKTYIYAESGQGEIFPLENLSATTCSQFWLILRLTLAKVILGKEKGIILLDDPFSTFDTLRKRHFIELLNAFALEGWQIICTITDDKTLYQLLEETFENSLEIVDLNRDIY